MRSFCGLCCARMRHYAPVCGVVRPRAFRSGNLCIKGCSRKGSHSPSFFLSLWLVC